MANEELATISGGGYSISLTITSISHGLDKQLVIIPIPNKGQSDTLTFLLDLRRCKEAVTIQGYITDTGTTSNLTQKAQLIDIMRKTATNLTLTWGGAGSYETIVGNVQKCDIKEEAVRVRDESDPGTATKAYNVQLVFVRGTQRG